MLAITEPYHTKFRFPLDGTRRHPSDMRLFGDPNSGIVQCGNKGEGGRG